MPEGRNTNVNGSSLAGPLIVARKAELGEISFVFLGADRNTSATIAAEDAAKENTIMEDTNDRSTATGVADQGKAPVKVEAQVTSDKDAGSGASCATSGWASRLWAWGSPRP